MTTNQRKGESDDDDACVSRIEIEFAIPTFLPQGFMRDLDELLSAAVRMKRNQPADGVHWVSGHGAKPMWSQADALFLGKSVADDAPASGEPRWDDSVYHIETTARPYVSEAERVREEKHQARASATSVDAVDPADGATPVGPRAQKESESI